MLKYMLFFQKNQRHQISLRFFWKKFNAQLATTFNTILVKTVAYNQREMYFDKFDEFVVEASKNMYLQ
jgi:hypothetical protein